MGSYRTLRRRRQRAYRKAHPRQSSGPGFTTPTWVVRDIVQMWAKELDLMRVIDRKY